MAPWAVQASGETPVPWSAGAYGCPPGPKAKGPTSQPSGGLCCRPSSSWSSPCHAWLTPARLWARRSAGSSPTDPAEDTTPWSSQRLCRTRPTCCWIPAGRPWRPEARPLEALCSCLRRAHTLDRAAMSRACGRKEHGERMQGCGGGSTQYQTHLLGTQVLCSGARSLVQAQLPLWSLHGLLNLERDAPGT